MSVFRRYLERNEIYGARANRIVLSNIDDIIVSIITRDYWVSTDNSRLWLIEQTLFPFIQNGNLYDLIGKQMISR